MKKTENPTATQTQGARTSRITLRSIILLSSLLIAIVTGVALSVVNNNKSALIGADGISGSSGGSNNASFIDGTPSAGTLYTLKRSGKVDREYLLRTPDGYTKNTQHKLVFFFHGWTGSSAEFVPKVNEYADADSFIIVAPHGYFDGVETNYPSWRFSGSSTGESLDGEPVCDTSVNDPNYTYSKCACKNRCCWTQCTDDDVQFVLDLLAVVKTKVNVDLDHVYASGNSNGGMFTWELARNAAAWHLFRAVAPIIGLPHRGFSMGKPATNSKKLLPALLITGTQDTTVPPGDDSLVGSTAYTTAEGGYYYVSAKAMTDAWAITNGCSSSSTINSFQGLNEPLLSCSTICTKSDNGGAPPMSVNCKGEFQHEDPLFAYKAVFSFFKLHYP